MYSCLVSFTEERRLDRVARNKAYRGLAEGSFLLPVCGCPWERVPIWRPRRESALLKDLATSGAARGCRKPTYAANIRGSEMNRGRHPWHSSANDSSK